MDLWTWFIFHMFRCVDNIDDAFPSLYCSLFKWMNESEEARDFGFLQDVMWWNDPYPKGRHGGIQWNRANSKTVNSFDSQAKVGYGSWR